MKEEGLLHRIVKTSVIVACFVTVYLASLGRIWESVSFLLGAAVSVAFFMALRAGVEYGVGPGTSKRKRLLGGLAAVLRYGMAAWLISWMVRWPNANMKFFLAGATVVPAVIVLKALGQLLADASASKR